MQKKDVNTELHLIQYSLYLDIGHLISVFETGLILPIQNFVYFLLTAL